MDPQIVDQVRLAGSVAPVDMSIFGLFSHADIIGKSIMIGLIMISVFTWALIFDKINKISRLKHRAEFFEERFWNAGSLDMLYEKIKRPGDPMQAVFVAGMKEWRTASEKGLLATAQGRSSILNRIDRVLQVTIGREMTSVETWMTFLASVSSIAPFIGLFGTVWGIMHSFIGIAQAQNTSLTVVAPGIAEALLATALGLVTAIPATAAYNKFSTEIGRYGARLENFSNDFMATLSRNMEEH
ncbi:MAG: protein TolQ [Proteobacteria bacterium]|jgi:biopolymer transport protein TolQ|nr:protein TolQ [Alphaproteobacteria bacterium]NCC04020.1 protein TolQ [Pseudomonadota bacterium]